MRIPDCACCMYFCEDAEFRPKVKTRGKCTRREGKRVYYNDTCQKGKWIPAGTDKKNALALDGRIE